MNRVYVLMCSPYTLMYLQGKDKYNTTPGVPFFLSFFLSFFFLSGRQPTVGHGFLIQEIFRSHTTTHHSQYESSLRVISQSQRPLLDNTQHSQLTDIHIPDGIRSHNLSRRVAADLPLGTWGHWDRTQASIGRNKFLLRVNI